MENHLNVYRKLTERLLVEGDRSSKKRVDDVWVVVKLLVDHKTKDTHLGSTAVVELDGNLLVNGLLIPTRLLELDSLDLILAGSISTLNEGDSEEGSEDGLRREIRQGSKTSLDVGKIISRGEGGWETVASSRDEVSEDGKLGDTAVLHLDKAKTIESLLIGISKEAKRIPETKRGLGTDGVLEVHLEGR